MSNLHPHWDTTDADEQSVPVRIKEKTVRVPPSSKKAPQVNRFPAAVFGIIAIAAAGFVVFDGMDFLQGQSVINAKDVHITANGLQPELVMVKPGENIRWFNDDAIPHILASDTLRDEDGEPFETTAIFPGSDHVFAIPAGTTPGSYDYVSRTSPSINGTIEVTSTQAPSSVAAMPMSQAASSIAALPVPSSASQAAVASVGGIPTNPYALSNTNYSAASTTQVTTATVTNHKPLAQPSTGMGLWMVGIAGAIALLFVLRKSAV
jgi:plastocyanin